MRLLLLAVLTVVAALLPAPAALAAEPLAEDPLLAPPGRCAADADPSAHHRRQRLALMCLLRGARRRAGLRSPREHAALRHSATYKARRIAACRVFTHAPCGDAFDRPFVQADLGLSGRWSVGETLAWGVGREGTARDVINRWLHSPSHRDVLLTASFTKVGVRRRRLRMRGAPVGAVLWVAHLGRRAAR